MLELRPPDVPAFAVGVLQRAGTERRLLTRAEHREIVTSLLGNDDRPHATEIRGTMLAYQASFLGAEELFVHAEAAGELERAEELHRITTAYLARLDALGAVDEACAIVQASLLLRDADALARERQRFDFLVVDDFQLAGFAVNRFVSQLAGPGGRSSVQGWQGGNVVVAGNREAAVGGALGMPVTGSHLEAFARRFGATVDVAIDGPSLRRPRPGLPPGPSVSVTALEHATAPWAVGREWPGVMVLGANEEGWLDPPPCPRYDWFDRAIFAGPDTPGSDERAEQWQAECRRRFLVASSRATEYLEFAPAWPFRGR